MKYHFPLFDKPNAQQRFTTIPAYEQVLNYLFLLNISNKFKLTNPECRNSGKPFDISCYFRATPHMSNYSKFLDDLEEFYTDRKLKGTAEKIQNDEALAAVRDKWIQQGKLTELISFIHTNWDSGNCDEFMEPFENLLIRTKQVDLYKQLWTKILKFRLSALWTSLDDLKANSKKVDTTEIASINTSDFNMFLRDSYKDLKRVVAFRRHFAIEGLTKMKLGLIELGDFEAASKVQTTIDKVNDLKRSTLQL
ncbi:MAG TPA: hypothetical protein VGN63_21595 [Flavisolibacter sp.]|nr:hypothetical protein [Flavisolibacter sp.]